MAYYKYNCPLHQYWECYFNAPLHDQSRYVGVSIICWPSCATSMCFLFCTLWIDVFCFGLWMAHSQIPCNAFPNNSTPRKNPVMMAVDLTPRFRRLNSQTRSFRENVQNGEYVFGINAFSRTIPTTKLSRYWNGAGRSDIYKITTHTHAHWSITVLHYCCTIVIMHPMEWC